MISASLVFYVEEQSGSSSGPTSVTLHRLLSPWVEGKDGANVVSEKVAKQFYCFAISSSASQHSSCCRSLSWTTCW